MPPQLVSTGMAEKYLPFSIYLYIYTNFYFIIFLNIITFSIHIPGLLLDYYAIMLCYSLLLKLLI